MKKGFTLIEVLIAVFLLTVGIVGILHVFPLGIQVAKFTQMASIATQLGQAKMEELVSGYYDDLPDTNTEDYGTILGFESYKRVSNVACVSPGLAEEVLCNYNVDDPFPLKKITVDVFWYSPLGSSEKNISLATLIARR